MLNDARNCVVTFTDCPIDLVEMSPISAHFLTSQRRESFHHYLQIEYLLT